MKFKSKGILDFFLRSLIPLHFQQTKKKLTREWWNKEKRSQFANLKISQQHYHSPHGLAWFLCLMAYQLFLGYLMPKPFS